MMQNKVSKPRNGIKMIMDGVRVTSTPIGPMCPSNPGSPAGPCEKKKKASMHVCVTPLV